MSGAPAFSRATASHDERPSRRRSTANCTTLMATLPSRMRRLPATASTQTHRICGSTSQWPSARTPPQGPLRRFFGQFIGHDMPVEPSTHWPHIRQSNRNPLTAFSTSRDRFLQALVADPLPRRVQRDQRALEQPIARLQPARVAHRPAAHRVHQATAPLMVRPACRDRRRAAFGDAVRADERFEIRVAVARLEPRRFGRGLGGEIVAAFARRAALPVGEIGVRAAAARAHRRAVDRLLEALRQRHLGGLAPLLDDRPAPECRARK